MKEMDKSWNIHEKTTNTARNHFYNPALKTSQPAKRLFRSTAMGGLDENPGAKGIEAEFCGLGIKITQGQKGSFFWFVFIPNFGCFLGSFG